MAAKSNKGRMIAWFRRSHRRRVYLRRKRIRAAVACIQRTEVGVRDLGKLLMAAGLPPKHGSRLAMCLPASHAGYNHEADVHYNRLIKSPWTPFGHSCVLDVSS